MLSGFEGDKIVRKVTMKAEEDKPLLLKILKISPPEKVACELKTVDKGKTFELVLQNKVQKRGKYSGSVTLETNYPKKPSIVIPFLGNVRGKLELRPGRINFLIQGSENSKKNDSYYRRSVLLTLHKGNGLKINKVEVNQKLFDAKVKELEAGKKYAIEVRLNRKDIGDEIVRETMKIYTNQKDDPVMAVPMRIQKTRVRRSRHHSTRDQKD